MTAWNESDASGQQPTADNKPQWSAQQLVRLENEWRRLQRSFAYHPQVRIIPLAGNPPTEYQVEYRLRTVVLEETGQLVYSDSCSVHFWLPPAFPYEPPLVRPISGIFHPNVTADGISLRKCWTSTTSTLAEVVIAVGMMACYQDWDDQDLVDEHAWQWVVANPQILPLDPDANLASEAGGDPLARICRFGPRTIDQIRSQLKQMCDSLLAAEGAPSAGETTTFVERTRQGLSLFLDEDIPQEMRSPASELDDFARELRSSEPIWRRCGCTARLRSADWR